MRNYIEQLNAEQRIAVQQPLCPVMVLAGPGTGKTKTLIGRVLALIDEPHCIPQENILVVTFTNQARNEIQHRILQEIGNCRVNIHTIHGFCLSLLKQYTTEANIPKNFNVADEQIQMRVLSKCINSKDEASLKHILDLISQHRFQIEIPGQVSEEILEAWTSRYEAQLRKHKFVDFDTMILATLDLLMDNMGVLQQVQAKYQAILVDEFQDVDIQQYEIFTRLAAHHRNIYVVCDDDQSIFLWRGAQVQNIVRFMHGYEISEEQGGLIVLQRNYRSTQSIIDLSTKLMVPYRPIEKSLKASKIFNIEEDIHYHVHANEEEQLEIIDGFISKYQKMGIPLHEIAVLCPTNLLSSNVERYCIEHQIPYQIFTSQSLFDYPELYQLLTLLRYVYVYFQQAQIPDKALDYQRDVIYEQIFYLFSGILGKVYQQIKYIQLDQSFIATIHKLYQEAFTQQAWTLNIDQEDFCYKVEFIDNLLKMLIREIQSSVFPHPLRLSEVLQIIEKYILYPSDNLYSYCGDLLVDPKDTNAAEILDTFLFDYNKFKLDDTYIVETCDLRLNTIVQYMFFETLKTIVPQKNIHIKTTMDSAVVHKNMEYIKITHIDKDEQIINEFYFKNIYEFFKVLQLVYAKYFHSIYNHYYCCYTLDEEERKLYILEVKNHWDGSTTVTSNWVIMNENFNEYILAIDHIHPIFVFQQQVLQGFNSAIYLPSFLKSTYEKHTDPHDIEYFINRFTMSNFSDHAEIEKCVTQSVRYLREKELQQVRKTALQELIPALSVGMYIDYPYKPTKKGEYFVPLSESYGLFIWGIQNFERMKYPEEIQEIYKQSKIDIYNFKQIVYKHYDIEAVAKPGFNALQELARQYEVEYFLEDTRHFLEDVTLANFSLAHSEFTSNVLQILTIHSSKGREFQVGFVIGLEDGLLPSTHAIRSFVDTRNPMFLDEQRRVLYVAMTRVKQFLHLMHVQMRNNRKTTPSRFLTEMEFEYESS